MLRGLLTSGLLLAAGSGVHAQGMWDAILTVDPYPTPYYSDWDSNPNIASLTLINSTIEPQSVRIHFNVINHANRVVVSGTSSPEPIAAGATVIFDNPYDVAGSTTHDQAMEDVAARTGRMPEGDYTACASATDGSGFVLAESCAPFSIVYPDPPLLLGPFDGEVVNQPDPLFMWTPVQVPLDYQLSYVVRVVEVLQGQPAAAALRENIPHYEALGEQFTTLRYPIEAQPLESGKRYAWWVQALDQNGYSAAANDGRSEVWTFRYEDNAAGPMPERSATVVLSLDSQADLRNDPLGVTNGLMRICSTWDTQEQLGSMTFPVMSEYIFPSSVTLQATVVRDTTADGDRSWSVSGPGGRHVFMVAGNCAADVTVPHWVGMRTADDAQELAEWLSTGSVGANTESGVTLKFGVAILSLFEDDLDDKAIGSVQAFLENHRFKVRRGLNVYGGIDAREIAFLWNLLDGAYDDDEHEIQLQGFVGFQQSFGVKLEATGTPRSVSADRPTVEAEQDLLVLRAALPRKTYDGAGIRSMQWGIELSLGGESSWGIGEDTLRDVKMKIAPKVFVNIVDGRAIKWTGTLAFPFEVDLKAMATKGPEAPEFQGVLLKLVSDYKWQPGPLAGSEFEIGEWEMSLKISELHFPVRSGLDLALTGNASLIALDQKVATVSLTLGRRAGKSNLDLAQDKYATDSTYVAAGELLVELSTERVRRAEAAGDTAALRLARAELATREADLAKSRTSARLSEGQRNVYRSTQNPNVNRGRTPQRADGSFYWKASMAFGNMGMVELLGFIGKIVEARRDQP